MADRYLAAPLALFVTLRDIAGSLNQRQVNIVNDIMEAAGHWPAAWLAYAIATAWHEARLEPQREWGLGKGKAYAKPGKYGQPQYGRGLVQLTWDSNYEWADKALGLNGALLSNFDLALDPVHSVAILVKGMEQGAFTGRKLSHYISKGSRTEFVSARRIINGTDRAEDIAGIAQRILVALTRGNWA